LGIGQRLLEFGGEFVDSHGDYRKKSIASYFVSRLLLFKSTLLKQRAKARKARK